MFYAGIFMNRLIICDQNKIMDFFTENEPDTVAAKLIARFPDREICAIRYAHYGQNLWGYALIKNGKRTQMKFVFDEQITLEGGLLEVENRLRSSSVVDEYGKPKYFLEDESIYVYEDDPSFEHKVLEAIFSKFAGSTLEDENLLNTTLKAYII